MAINSAANARFKQCLLASTLLLSSLSSAGTYVGIVQGLSGEAYYQRHFDEQFETISESAIRLAGAENVQSFRAGDARRNNVLSWLGELNSKAGANDQLIIYLIGHGTFNEREYKFNLSGPDISGEDLKSALMGSAESESNNPSRVLINTSSSSGALLELFEDQDLMLITATKNGLERNATRFGRHFAEALNDDSADIDKNKAISLKEAFDYAERQTADFYQSEGLLATEHPRLQVKKGQPQSRTSLINLARLGNQLNRSSNVTLASLYVERDNIDRRIDNLRLRRIGMSDQDYAADFQLLMIDLAMVQSEIDQVKEAEAER